MLKNPVNFPERLSGYEAMRRIHHRDPDALKLAEAVCIFSDSASLVG
jgi:hypothetical protein